MWLRQIKLYETPKLAAVSLKKSRRTGLASPPVILELAFFYWLILAFFLGRF
jgi:hypothetical protein